MQIRVSDRGSGLVALTLMVMIACAEKTEAQAAPSGFEQVNGAGFRLQKPVGWAVDAVNATRFVVRDPSTTAMAAITAVPVRGDVVKALVSLETWAKSGKVVARDAPAKNVQRAELALIDKDDKNVTAHVVIIDGGGIATVYWASAPQESFARQLPTLVTVLDSFRLVKAPSPSAAVKPVRDYVQWVDPREHSFSTEVPKGWKVEGGLFRVGAIGTRVGVVVNAPDDAIQIILGDMSTPRFILPSELVCSLGNCNGQPMANGDVVAQFMHAGDIGAQIIQRRFGGQPTGRRERNDIVELRRTKQPMMGGTINAMTAADVDFRLADGRIGTATIVNSGYQVPGLGGAWSVDDFAAFITPTKRTAEAVDVFAHIVGAMRTNPQWLAAELQSQAAASEQYLAYQRESAQLQQRVIEERWASQDRQHKDFRDALTNTVRLQDPQTHETIELQSSDRYFFRTTDPLRDAVIGTQGDENPAPLDMRRLLEIKH